MLIYQTFDTDISKFSIFPPAIRYDTVCRYRIDMSIFSLYRSSTRYGEAYPGDSELYTKQNQSERVFRLLDSFAIVI